MVKGVPAFDRNRRHRHHGYGYRDCLQTNKKQICEQLRGYVRTKYVRIRSFTANNGRDFRYFIEFLVSRQFRAYPYEISDDSFWERFATRNNRTFSGQTRTEYKPKVRFCTFMFSRFENVLFGYFFFFSYSYKPFYSGIVSNSETKLDISLQRTSKRPSFCFCLINTTSRVIYVLI